MDIQAIIRYLRKTKNYARITGIVFFAIGLLGFVFKSSSSLPDIYLLLFLVVGFWGILVSIRRV